LFVFTFPASLYALLARQHRQLTQLLLQTLSIAVIDSGTRRQGCRLLETEFEQSLTGHTDLLTFLYNSRCDPYHSADRGSLASISSNSTDQGAQTCASENPFG
jgi:hypothetical protein